MNLSLSLSQYQIEVSYSNFSTYDWPFVLFSLVLTSCCWFLSYHCLNLCLDYHHFRPAFWYSYSWIFQLVINWIDFSMFIDWWSALVAVLWNSQIFVFFLLRIWKFFHRNVYNHLHKQSNWTKINNKSQSRLRLTEQTVSHRWKDSNTSLITIVYVDDTVEKDNEGFGIRPSFSKDETPLESSIWATTTNFFLMIQQWYVCKI